MTLSDYLYEARGRQTALASHLGVSASTVSMWASGARLVPIRFLLPIRAWSKRKISLAELRPDIYGVKTEG